VSGALRRAGYAALGCLLLAALAASAAPAIADGPVTSPLARAGKWLVDSEGRVVIVHGVDIVHKIAPYYPNNFGQQDAQFLANEGFTVARIGFIWSSVEPQPGKYDDGYIRDMIGFNNLLARYGIRTLVDFHQDSWSSSAGGDGAPSWATLGSNFLDDFQDFWDNDPAPDGVGIQTHFVNAWVHVIRPLDASPGAANILGLDPFNEPYAGTDSGCVPFTPCPQFESGELAEFYTRVIAAIRATGDDHVIFPEGIAQNGIAEPSLPKFADPQTAFTFHYYCPITQTATSSSPVDAACSPYEQHGVGNFVAYADRLDVPSFLGEFSCNDADDDNAAMVDLADQDFVSWTIWMYYTYAHDPADCAGQGLLIDDNKPGSMANAKLAKLDAIVVPYPQAIAGTPKSYAYDRSTDTMTLTYQATAVPGAHLAAGALTQIFVPELQYPHGYQVAVTGARVVSAATAPWVELAADPGADVSATITPAADSATQLPLEVWSPETASQLAACARATRASAARSLGPVHLGMTRAQAQRQFAPSSTRGRRYMDFFCTHDDGISAGYPSPRLLRTLSPAERRRLGGRVVLILTASPMYTLRGVAPGTRLAKVARRLHVSRPYKVGANTWYLVPDGPVRGVLKVRHGAIQEIGITDALFGSSHHEAAIFFSSFG
jgi:endoglycosylceramidase